MLGKFSVKKPYTVIVGVILVIILGVISFMNMTTDLLPSMNFPYVIVYTTYIGATPEQVETDVTRPMEASFATLTDIKNVSSTSSDNLSLVMLEFNDSADMNTALIEINSKVTTLSAGWSDSVGAPAIMKINPDMLPVSIVSVAKDDMDIIELSEYVEKTLIPEYESINGVASVTASGVITQQVDITIEQDRIDVLNNAILRDIDAELADVEQQLNDAQAQISDGKSQLARARKSTLAQIDDGLKQVTSGEEQLSAAIEQLTAQRAELATQQQELAKTIEQLESLVNMTDEQRQMLQSLENQMASLRAEKQKLEQQLETLKATQDTSALDRQREEAIAERNALIAERTRYEEYLKDLNAADPAAIRLEIDALNSQIAAKQGEISAAQDALNAAAAEQAAAQEHVNALKDAIAGQETQAPDNTQTPATTQAPEDTSAPTETDAPATSDAPTDTAATDTPTDTASPSANDNAGQSPEPAASETAPADPFAASAAEQTLDELKAELSAAEAALSEKNAALQAAQTALDQKNAELSDLNARLERKQKALDDVQSEDMLSRKQAAQREIDRLNLRIAALDAEIEALGNMSGDSSVAIQQLEASIAALDQAISAIENSDEYKALKLALDQDALNAQYAAATQGKAQLDAGIAQIDATLAKLNQGVIPGGMIEGMDEDTSITDAKAQLTSGREQALAAFAEAESQLESASAELASARSEFEEKRDEALENAGLDGVITLQTVAGILGAQNMSMPAGYVYDLEENQYLVRVGDKFASLDELKNLKLFSIGTDSVDEVRLCDVASVAITDDSADSFTKVNGQDGIMLSIEKQSTFSTTEVAELVEARSAKLMDEDAGLTVVDLFNQGQYINIIVDSVIENLISGGILAVLILLIFLMDYRPTIIIACSIPLSVVIAFVCMYFTGITLNVLSLSGLALGVGMLVDNSIVAIENIYRLYNEEHKPLLTACIEGVGQVSGALFSSTLTTICVFLPIVFVEGMARDLFSDLGLVFTFSLLASLLVAMTLVPSMAAGLLKRQKKVRRQPVFSAIQRAYGRLLNGALRLKLLVLAAAVALLVFSVMQIPGMGMSFMPEVNATQMTATLPLDPEAETAPQQEQAIELMNRMLEIDGIEHIGLTGASGMASLTGGSESLTYYIIVSENAGRKNADIAKDIQRLSEDMALELSVSTSTMDISMLTGSGISVDITGPENDELRRIAGEVTEIIRGLDGAAEIDDGLQESVPEIRITVDKEKAIDKGLTVGQVMQFVAQKIAGKTEITQITLDGKTLSVYMLDGRNATITPDTLENLEIETTVTDGTELVRIGDIAEVGMAEGFASINRQSQQRVLSVSFQVADGYSANHVSDALEEKLANYAVPEGYSVGLSGENETVSAIMDDLIFMVVIAIVLIFLIMVAQFQSFKSPIIVLFTIPLAFTGGLAALLLTGMDLSIVAMVGFLMLSGVVVNNGIVFVDSVNQMRIAGMSKREALLETGRIRLRPILMTALTTILGMSTMALGTGMGAEMMQPMAVVTIGGLAYATLMTLFVVPAMYDLINGEKMSAREIEMAKESMGLEEEPKAQPHDPEPVQVHPAKHAAKKPEAEEPVSAAPQSAPVRAVAIAVPVQRPQAAPSPKRRPDAQPDRQSRPVPRPSSGAQRRADRRSRVRRKLDKD